MFFTRLTAMIVKEALQMRRDRLTLGMVFGVPIMLLILFGFAINLDPKGLPAAIVSGDQSQITRTIVSGLSNSGYFSFVKGVDDAEANELLQRGNVQFVLSIPPDFTRRFIRRDKPQIVVEADATDPATTGNALASINEAVADALAHDLTGPLAAYASSPAGPVDIVIHRRYNPEGITRYNIVPGLIGVILTMTMVMMTALTVTRERERGTMENLLAMPIRPLEVMIGKIAPYIVIGFLQVVVILLVARFVFAVPMIGNLATLGFATMLFITVNLSIGFTFSTIAENQLQAVQLSIFFSCPRSC